MLPKLNDERPPSSDEAFEQAIELLRSDRARGFTIDVETDTMVFEDQRAERSARIEFITAVSGFLKEAIPAVERYPQAAQVLMELLMFGVRGFKAGRQIEAVFDEAAEQVSELANEPQKPRTDPKVEAEKARVMAEQERLKLTREDNDLRRQADFADQEARRAADLEHEARKLDMQEAAQNLKAMATTPAVQPDPQTMVTDREKFEFERSLKEREYNLKRAAQNKQIMTETESELGDDQSTEVAKSPLEMMMAGISELAMVIAQGQAQQSEQFAQLAQLIAAPRNVDLKRGRDGKATGATSSIALN